MLKTATELLTKDLERLEAIELSKRIKVLIALSKQQDYYVNAHKFDNVKI